jgi:hypothetical protein
MFGSTGNAKSRGPGTVLPCNIYPKGWGRALVQQSGVVKKKAARRDAVRPNARSGKPSRVSGAVPASNRG